MLSDFVQMAGVGLTYCIVLHLSLPLAKTYIFEKFFNGSDPQSLYLMPLRDAK